MSVKRINALKKLVGEKDLFAILVTNIINVRYLTGFTGTEGSLLASKKSAIFFTDSRYDIQSKAQVKGAKVEIFNEKISAISEAVKQMKAATVGIEGNHVCVNLRNSLATRLKGIKLVPLKSDVDSLRIKKDPSEIDALKAVIAVSERAFKKTLRKIKAGAMERDVARYFEMHQLLFGAEGASFETIVGSGPRGALPHGVASDKVIKDGELVVMDFGAIMNQYNSDQTMTVAVGKVTAEMKKVYEVVYDAQQRAIEAVRPGITGKQLHLVAAKIIEDAGYGKFFGHGLGHGVGMEIHEAPRASILYPAKLEAGSVVTIEPGIYLPGKFGVRLEDMVLITDSGCELLTTLDKRFKGKTA